jgi:hypothetical protein
MAVNTSLTISEAWAQDWISKNNAAIQPTVYNEMFKNYGQCAGFFELMNTPERKIYVHNATITTFERQWPERAVQIAAAIAANNVGDNISVRLHASNFDANNNHQVRIGDTLYIPPRYATGNVARGYRVQSWSTTVLANDTLAMEPYSADGNTITSRRQHNNRFADCGTGASQHMADGPRAQLIYPWFRAASRYD